METTYFVILNHPRHGLVFPLLDETEEKLLVFENEEEAITAGENTFLGSGYGFKAFEI